MDTTDDIVVRVDILFYKIHILASILPGTARDNGTSEPRGQAQVGSQDIVDENVTLAVLRDNFFELCFSG